MSSQTLFGELDALRAGLRSLLERIEGGTAEEGGIQQAMAACEQTFQALGDLSRIGERVEESEIEALRDVLQDMVRLYAITTSAASADLDRIGDLTARAGKARKSFAYYDGSKSPGGTCNLAG